MKKKEGSKTGAQKNIEYFFKDVMGKTPEEIKKIKKLAMSYKIPLKEKRKLFCKKCFTPYCGKECIRIQNKIKSITCNCGNISRWKIK